MACTLQAPCGGVLRDDAEFNAAMAVGGIPRRRRSCLNGHTFIKRLKLGRPRRGTERVFHCRICQKPFRRYLTASKKHPTTCSARCRTLAASRSLRKVTVTDEVRAARLYAKNYSMAEIGVLLGYAKSTVREMLRRSRVVCRRRTSATRCIESGCAEAPNKERNNRGYLFGRRCHAHLLVYKRACSARFRERRRARAAAVRAA